jgi:predicted glycoside hydrolase/deacetylase ChbG (UPF0249 family)
MPLTNAISVETMVAILAGLPEGITELACHPGLSDDLETMYRNERAQELSTLCDPRVRNAIDSMDIQLCSFCDVTDRSTGAAVVGDDRRAPRTV